MVGSATFAGLASFHQLLRPDLVITSAYIADNKKSERTQNAFEECLIDKTKITMRRGGFRGGRGGGGLYGNFVSASDNVSNTPYRGAEIPPPPTLTHGGDQQVSMNRFPPPPSLMGHPNASANRGGISMQIRGKGPPGGLPASLGGPGPPSQSRGGAAVPPPQLIYAPKPVGLTKAATDLSKSGFSRESSLGDASLSYSQYGVAIKRQRTEDEYFNSDDEVEDIAKLEEETPAYQPAPGSPSYKVSQFAFPKSFLQLASSLLSRKRRRTSWTLI